MGILQTDIIAVPAPQQPPEIIYFLKTPEYDPYFGTPISYPSNTSVEEPSQPRFPAVEIKYLHVGSM